jgi:hypothetical protein
MVRGAKDKPEAGRTECPYCKAKGPASYSGTRAGYIQSRCNCCGKTWELPAPPKEGQSRGPFHEPRYAAGIAPPWDVQLKLDGFVVGAPETREDAQTSLHDLEQKIRAFQARFPRAELETGVGASGREWGRLYTRYQNLVSYMVHRGWLQKAEGDDNAHAKSRTEELQHFTEIVVRLHELKRLHPLWAHLGATGIDLEYIREIRGLTEECERSLSKLDRFGISRQSLDQYSRQLQARSDASELSEFPQLGEDHPQAGVVAPALPVEPKAKREPIYGSRDLDINRRRFIVAQNPDTQADGLCSLFDNSIPPIPLTPRMREAGTWFKAYRISRHRHAIDSLISRDRKEVGI